MKGIRQLVKSIYTATPTKGYDMTDQVETEPVTEEAQPVLGHGQLLVCVCGTVHEDDGDKCRNCGRDLR